MDEIVSDDLRLARLAARVSQIELAAEYGCRRGQIVYIEGRSARSPRRLRGSTVARYMAALRRIVAAR
jgi:hypothetical protein